MEDNKLIQLGLAENFSADLKFDVDLPNPTPEFKYVLLNKDHSQITEAKITLFDIYQQPKIFVPANMQMKMTEINQLNYIKEDKGDKIDLEEELS